ARCAAAACSRGRTSVGEASGRAASCTCPEQARRKTAWGYLWHTGQRDEHLRQVRARTQAAPGSGEHGGHGRGGLAAACWGQDARTSSRRASACSSSVFSASASSETRICRARANIRFSPADRPRSASRRERSRTTSATLMTSPEAIFSTFALYRRDQLVGSSV